MFKFVIDQNKLQKWLRIMHILAIIIFIKPTLLFLQFLRVFKKVYSNKILPLNKTSEKFKYNYLHSL